LGAKAHLQALFSLKRALNISYHTLGRKILIFYYTSPVSSQKISTKRALYSLKRALDIYRGWKAHLWSAVQPSCHQKISTKKALYSLKRALYSLRRALYIYTRAGRHIFGALCRAILSSKDFNQKSLIFSQKSPIHIYQGWKAHLWSAVQPSCHQKISTKRAIYSLKRALDIYQGWKAHLWSAVQPSCHQNSTLVATPFCLLLLLLFGRLRGAHAEIDTGRNSQTLADVQR